MSEHICQEPGCGMKMLYHANYRGGLHCPRNADAHELCARVAELEALLGVAVEKLESFKETGGVWNDDDEPTLVLLHKAAKGGTP